MEILIKTWDILSLVNIPDNELPLIKEEVITEFNINEEDRKKIYKWCTLNADFSITETKEYLENINIELKQEKKEAIAKIATITDQLNLTAGTLDLVVDLLAQTNPNLLENPWIIESKEKLHWIKDILNK